MERISKHYEILIYSTSEKEYTNKLINIIDPKKYIKHRLYKDSCTLFNGTYCLEIKKLNRQLKKTIIVDNNPNAYIFNIENGIPIKSFYGDPNDKELIQLAYILERLAKFDDVRIPLKEIVEDDTINYDKAYELLRSKSNYISKTLKRTSKKLTNIDITNINIKSDERKSNPATSRLKNIAIPNQIEKLNKIQTQKNCKLMTTHSLKNLALPNYLKQQIKMLKMEKQTIALDIKNDLSSNKNLSLKSGLRLNSNTKNHCQKKRNENINSSILEIKQLVTHKKSIIKNKISCKIISKNKKIKKSSDIFDNKLKNNKCSIKVASPTKNDHLNIDNFNNKNNKKIMPKKSIITHSNLSMTNKSNYNPKETQFKKHKNGNKDLSKSSVYNVRKCQILLSESTTPEIEIISYFYHNKRIKSNSKNTSKPQKLNLGDFNNIHKENGGCEDIKNTQEYMKENGCNIVFTNSLSSLNSSKKNIKPKTQNKKNI